MLNMADLDPDHMQIPSSCSINIIYFVIAVVEGEQVKGGDRALSGRDDPFFNWFRAQVSHFTRW